METKLENYEKEIKQLQKALEKSDKYIQELESQYCNKKPTSSPTSVASYQKILDESKSIKNDSNNIMFKNEIKNVKFADNTESNAKNVSSNHSNDMLASSSASASSSTSNTSVKQGIITNDKFYGSPKKTTSRSSSSSRNIILTPNKSQFKQVSSFNERLKKNLSFDLEVPSPLTQSLNCTAASIVNTLKSECDTSKTNGNSSESYKELLNEPKSQPPSNNYSTSNQHDFLFSPMKRLRLDEFQLEKPSFSVVFDDTVTVGNTGDAGSSNDSNGDIKNEKIETQSKSEVRSHISKDLNASLTPEFTDCLQLLNEAESKIQNRSSPYMPKYSTSSNGFDKESSTNSSSNNGIFSSVISSYIKNNPIATTTKTYSSIATNNQNSSDLNKYQLPYNKANEKLNSNASPEKRDNKSDESNSTNLASLGYAGQHKSPLSHDYKASNKLSLGLATGILHRSRSVEPNS